MDASAKLNAGALDRFARVARPIMLRWMTPNSCIGATKLAQLVLRHFAIELVPVATAFGFEVADAKYGYVSGVRGKEKARIRREAAAWVDRYSGSEMWNGHLVGIAAERFLLDCSFDQVSSPEHGVVVDPVCLLIDMGRDGAAEFRESGQVELGLVMDDGRKARVMYSPMSDHSWSKNGGLERQGSPAARA
jgi:hypothetical protein